MDCLLQRQVSDRMAVLMAKIYILQLIFPIDRKKYYSVMSYPQLDLLLLRYGRPIEFIIIATALHLNPLANDYFLLKFTFKLLSKFKD
mgnify:CR=1 FL=1